MKVNKMNYEEKLSILDKIEERLYDEQTSIEYLMTLFNDKEDEIRSRVAEVLILFESFQAKQILLKLLNDKDELVRTNVCDSLSNINSLDVVNILKSKVKNDKSSLVRSYAILAIVDIFINNKFDIKENLVLFFKTALKKEKIIGVKICYYKALYILLGDNNYLFLLIAELNNRLYRNRCATVNLLISLINKGNKNIIYEALVKRLNIEKTIAVKSSIEKIIDNLDEYL